MTSELQAALITLVASGSVGWAISVSGRLASHEAIMEKLDQLITLLLEDRLAQGQEGCQAQDTGNRSRRDQRRDR